MRRRPASGRRAPKQRATGHPVVGQTVAGQRSTARASWKGARSITGHQAPGKTFPRIQRHQLIGAETVCVRNVPRLLPQGDPLLVAGQTVEARAKFGREALELAECTNGLEYLRIQLDRRVSRENAG